MKKSPEKKEALLRSNKLHRKQEFELLRRNAKKMVARHWILFYQKNNLSLCRLATTASSRFGNAVKRNQFKRWMREHFRKNKEKFSGFDLHFVAKSSRHEKVQRLIKQEMDEDYVRLLRQFA